MFDAGYRGVDNAFPPEIASKPYISRGSRVAKPSEVALCAYLFAAIAFANSNVGLSTCHAADQTAKPNIIFIMADDLGYHDLGCYGQQKIKTPNIDQMASEGMRFTNVYAGSPVCAPSRSVLVTGKHTGHTTVRGNFGKFGVKGLGGGNGRVPLKASDVTVAEVLKKAGYATGMVGKWGLGEPNTSGEPGQQGWDYFFGHLNQRRAHSYYPDYLWRNDERVPLEGNQNGKRTQHSHAMFTDEALGFIEKQAATDQPFFLYLPYTFPHSHYEIPSVGEYADTDWGKDAKVHAAMVTTLDTDLGRILSLLKSLKIDDNTMVFFCSDNGAAQRWKGLFDSSHPLRGRKRDVYEGGIRTPMIVRQPGRVPAGEVSDSPWAFWDVLPTLAEVAGVEAKTLPQVDGVSAAPTLIGKSQPELADRYFYWEFYEGGFVQAARRNDWKAVRFAGKPLELYNLADDLGETTNVADKHPQVVKQFADYLASARTPSRNWPAPVD